MRSWGAVAERMCGQLGMGIDLQQDMRQTASEMPATIWHDAGDGI